MFEILGITFHWYGLLIGLAVAAAMEIALFRSGKIEKENLENAIWWVILAGVIGARLYHVIDYWSRYYSANPIKILYFWEGGLGIWGAISGGFLGLLIYCHFNKLKFWEYLDVMVIGVPMAQAIGRVGNYINGELWGKNGEPLFAYEGLLNLMLFGILWKASSKKQRSGTLSGIYLIGYGVIRALLEDMRPEENIWKIGGIPTAIIFSMAAIFAGGYLIFRRKQS
jgi:phosphatidylglycerol---prolipoprotein diacylglyceryl transferase